MHFYWVYGVMIWGASWCATLVYPTFIISGKFSWGYVFSVLYYQSMNLIITVPFVLMALFMIYQLTKNVLAQVKYAKVYFSMVPPVLVSAAGGIYLLMHTTGLTLFFISIYVLFRLLFGGTKRSLTNTRIQQFK